MRVSIAISGWLVLIAAIGSAQSGYKAPNNQPQTLLELPGTVDEAVLILKTKWLKPKDLDWILRNPQKEAVSILYRPFGTGVRNQFGLWGSNQKLRDSCGTNDPEGCSVVIFNRLWESVRADADPSLVRQLDCEFQVAKSIQINEKGFYKLTTRELIKSLQSQINQQLAKLNSTGAPSCQSSLKLEVAGKPDTSCYVDAPTSPNHLNGPKKVSLSDALAGLGFLNLFNSTYVPPGITLSFARQCQFPTPPYLYGK